MSSIAIVGAGAGLGLSIAKVFGRHGFDVALIARNEEKLDGFTASLEADGVKAAGFTADAADQTALASAMERAAERFDGIDVLEFSVPPGGITAALDVSVENLRPQFECICYGAVTATRAVLPAMLAADTGTLLFTTGASSVTPRPMFGNAGAAGAALRNWALNLNSALADKGVYAGHVAIGAWISGTPGPADAPRLEPDDIAGIYWDLHTARDRAEYLITA
ncbi:SDR family NAD(P)-dependent oxidoreductase [Actinoallomurus acanthiterrae]